MVGTVRVSVETQRGNRRYAQTEAYAAALYVCVVDWATHCGHTRPQGPCALGETITNPNVMAVQALGRVELTPPWWVGKAS